MVFNLFLGMVLEFFSPNLEFLFITSWMFYLILASLYVFHFGNSWPINHSKTVLSLGHSSEPVITSTTNLNFSAWLQKLFVIWFSSI